jgi:hypothetical protein
MIGPRPVGQSVRGQQYPIGPENSRPHLEHLEAGSGWILGLSQSGV